MCCGDTFQLSSLRLKKTSCHVSCWNDNAMTGAGCPLFLFPLPPTPRIQKCNYPIEGGDRSKSCSSTARSKSQLPCHAVATWSLARSACNASMMKRCLENDVLAREVIAMMTLQSSVQATVLCVQVRARCRLHVTLIKRACAAGKEMHSKQSGLSMAGSAPKQIRKVAAFNFTHEPFKVGPAPVKGRKLGEASLIRLRVLSVRCGLLICQALCGRFRISRQYTV